MNELLGIQLKIAKADRTDKRVQNLSVHINKEMLLTIHKKMDKRKAYGVDGITKEDYAYLGLYFSAI